MTRRQRPIAVKESVPNCCQGVGGAPKKEGGKRLDKFILHSEYKPTGDQPEAISELTKGIFAGDREQTLLGVTGSGKTFTMANIIANVNRPTLVLAHNKTLAAQLCTEFREFFPENAVEYFVSYYKIRTKSRDKTLFLSAF